MKNTTQKSIELVKKKLWKFGYSVKDYTIIPMANVKFDLLIDNKIKVKVGTTKIKVIPNDFDVYSFVDKQNVIFITKPKNGLDEFTSPYEVFGRPNQTYANNTKQQNDSDLAREQGTKE